MSANAASAPVPHEVPVVIPAPTPSGELRRFVRNTVAIAFVGVAISWWLLEFTDFFPAVGGFLGLGGIFAWVAFFSNLVRDDRKKELQHEIEHRLLLGRATASYAFLVLIGCGVFAVLHGTIVLIAAGEGGKRAVEIRDGARVVETIEVAPGSTAKVSLWALNGRRELILKAEGLPELSVTLRNLERTTVVIPQAFMAQAVLLARPTTDVVDASAKSAIKVKIMRTPGKWEEYGTIRSGAYGGESIWIGSSADLRVPANVEERWRRQLGGETPTFFKWLQPKGVGADWPLRAGDRIVVCVMSPDNNLREMASGEAVVLPAKQRPFPQEIEVAVPAGDMTRCGV